LVQNRIRVTSQIDPRDMRMMVEVANALAREVRHSIEYIHMVFDFQWDVLTSRA